MEQRDWEGPKDHGLVSLGLIMQNIGVSTLAMSFLFLMGLVAAAGGRSDNKGLLFLLFLICMIRSIVHAVCGRGLTAGAHRFPVRTPLSLLTRYFVVSAIQTVLLLVIVKKLESALPVTGLIVLGLYLMAWPTALFIVARLGPIARIEQLEEADDQGLAGLAILMTILGGFGMCLGLAYVWPILAHFSKLSANMGWLLAVAIIVLAVRGVIHFVYGVRSMAEPLSGWHNADTYVRLATRLGLGALVALMVWTFASMSEAPRGGVGILFGVLGMMTILVLAWPMIIRYYLTDRSLLETPPQRDADQGFTTIGWLLLGIGAFSVAGLLMTVLAEGGAVGGISSLFGSLGGGGRGAAPAETTPAWELGLSVVSSAAALASGILILRGNLIGRIATFVYAGAAGIVGLVAAIKLLGNWSAVTESGLGSTALMMTFLVLTTQLILPIVAFIVALRFRGGTSGRREVGLPPAAGGFPSP